VFHVSLAIAWHFAGAPGGRIFFRRVFGGREEANGIGAFAAEGAAGVFTARQALGVAVPSAIGVRAKPESCFQLLAKVFPFVAHVLTQAAMF
jgi:hypothetical protein